MKSKSYKGFTIYHFDHLESTNSYAFEMAETRKFFDRDVIVADLQTSGRGRNKRNWHSPLGNLYFSLVLQPKIIVDKVPQISFVAVTALRLALEKLCQNSVENKWPNDLLIDQKKVSGLLLESKVLGDQLEFVVLGIGLNTESNPINTIFPSTNLKDLGIKISPEEALQKFLDEFDKIYQSWLDFGFTGIRKLWLQRAFCLHKKINVKINEKEIEGVFEDLDQEGNLLLRTSTKSHHDELIIPDLQAMRQVQDFPQSQMKISEQAARQDSELLIISAADIFISKH